ncbi:MAG: hypothetical protein M3405_12225 [Acidobacteriota bacterium]|jgi:glycosyltransferase involved in cell wall biosynthesis|nr:hypothetical protein [Acidobacteriota bacterium]
MRVVILTPIPFWHPGTGELIELLKANGINVWAFDIFNARVIDDKGILHDYKPTYLKGLFGKVYLKLFRKSIISKQIRDNDIIDIHFVESAYGRYINTLKSKKTKLITTLFGSDLFRTNNSQKKLQTPLFEKADAVVLSENMIPYFEEHFPGYESKYVLNQYGSSRLDLIDKKTSKFNRNEIREKYGITKDKIVISCGYNAKKEQQHLKILDEINKFSEVDKKHLFLIFLLTYGIDESGGEYVNLIKKKFQESGMPNLCMENRLTDEEIAEVRIISDITINMQTTDALASSIKEAMVAGDIMLIGEWLPYEIYKNLGVFYLTTSFETLYEKLKYILNNFDELRDKSEANREKILNFASWKILINDWIKLYKEV